MSDEPKGMLPLPSKSTRRNIVYATILFCFGIITYVVAFGDGTNSLHSSALAWAFTTSIFVISGYVFGAVAESWVESRINK